MPLEDAMKKRCGNPFSRCASGALAIALLAGFLLNPFAVSAQVKSKAMRSGLAPTPPMGWNSWDCYGTTVTEAEVKAQADYMRQHLARYGWQYVVVYIQWYEPNAKAH